MKRLFGVFARDERGSMVATIGKASLAIAFLSVLAANWLSTGVSELDRNNLAQLASSVSGRQVQDPMTTASISRRAADTKLDPCVMPPKR